MLLWSHSFQLMNFNMIRRGALREKLPLLWVGHRDQLKEAQNGADILMTRCINRCRLVSRLKPVDQERSPVLTG